MKIAIIGLGMLGGSIAYACKKKQLATVIACDIDREALAYAAEQSISDEYHCAIDSWISDVDLIIIAAPLDEFAKVLKNLKGYLTDKQIITDVCSVKTAMTDSGKQILAKKSKQFVPAHPMFGSEKSGIKNIKKDLPQHYHVFLTPMPETDKTAIKIVEDFWHKLGGSVITTTAHQHDAIVAAISHLPHVISYAFSGMFAERKQITTYAAGSYADMTRIAASDCKNWANIFLANKELLLSEINKFKLQLDAIQNAITQNDLNMLINLLKNARPI
jgi:3-phosphoshikimate 1-carboxyvinyltransferase